MLSTFLKPFSDLIQRSSVRLISSSETARSLRFSTSVTFRTICIRPLLVRVRSRMPWTVMTLPFSKSSRRFKGMERVSSSLVLSSTSLSVAVW